MLAHALRNTLPLAAAFGILTKEQCSRYCIVEIRLYRISKLRIYVHVHVNLRISRAPVESRKLLIYKGRVFDKTNVYVHLMFFVEARSRDLNGCRFS